MNTSMKANTRTELNLDELEQVNGGETDPVGVVITNMALKAQEYNDDAYAFDVVREVFPPLLPFAKYVGGVAGFFSGISQLITDGMKKPEYLTHNS